MDRQFSCTATPRPQRWLIARLEAFRDPVDLVGHDWGGAHVLNAVMQRPDLVRNWVSDALRLFDPDYVWHPLARTKQWSTPPPGASSQSQTPTSTLNPTEENVMPSTEIDPADLDAAVAAFPSDSPLFMVNLLRFHDQALYTSASEGEPCSGQEAYLTRYLPAFNSAVQPYGGSELVFAGIVIARVVGPVDDGWDAVGLARYPSISAFRNLVNDAGYQTTAEPHRRAALADWRLYATTALNREG